MISALKHRWIGLRNKGSGNWFSCEHSCWHKGREQNRREKRGEKSKKLILGKVRGKEKRFRRRWVENIGIALVVFKGRREN